MANVLALPGPNSKYQQPGATPAGFWAGFWNGVLFPLTFIISLFTLKVRIYETSNKGRWYDFGFILGASGSVGGSGSQVDSVSAPTTLSV